MAKQYTSTEPKQDEFSKIFSDYRAKIEEITRRTEKNLNSIEAKPVEVQPIEAKFIENQADEDEHIEVVTAPPRPEAAIDSNIQAQLENVFLQNIEPAFKPEVVESAGEIFAGITLIPRKEPAQKPEAVNTLVDGVRPAFEGSDEILNQARREAKQIIEEAEESAKKKARKRTQSQVDKFIEKARK
jgi:vacuolar-type H+-ATPase subunit E/Vma4